MAHNHACSLRNAFTEFTVVSKNVDLYWETWKYFEIQEAHLARNFLGANSRC